MRGCVMTHALVRFSLLVALAACSPRCIRCADRDTRPGRNCNLHQMTGRSSALRPVPTASFISATRCLRSMATNRPRRPAAGSCCASRISTSAARGRNSWPASSKTCAGWGSNGKNRCCSSRSAWRLIARRRGVSQPWDCSIRALPRDRRSKSRSRMARPIRTVRRSIPGCGRGARRWRSRQKRAAGESLALRIDMAAALKLGTEKLRGAPLTFVEMAGMARGRLSRRTPSDGAMP